jgi:hypothetical protein
MDKKQKHEIKRHAERKLAKKLGLGSRAWREHKEANASKQRRSRSTK